MMRHALLAAALAAGTWQIAADDLVPPGWERPTGQPGGNPDATYSRWETLGPTGPIYSDYATWGAHVVPTPTYPVVDRGVAAPGGPLEFTGTANSHAYWPGVFTGDNSGRTGVAALSGDLNFLIPNTPRYHNPEKMMQVQVTWKPEAAGGQPDLHADAIQLSSVTDNEWAKTTVPLTDGWFHTTYDGVGFWDPTRQSLVNPEGESFTLSGNIYVDQVVIDTLCVPEPGQIAMGVMTVLFGAGYAWRRYRLTK